MKLKKIMRLKLLFLIFFALRANAHTTNKECFNEPKAVELSSQDIKFVIENPNVSLAYIPEIIKELFTLLKDIDEVATFDFGLKEFVMKIENGSRVTTRSIALNGIFGALNLLKKHEATLPKAYLEQFCDVLFGYQKSLHKEESIFQEM